MLSQGVIYIATGKKYIHEACRSAASVKAHMPSLLITIFADEEVDSPHIEQTVLIKAINWDSWAKRIEYMYQSPYDQTLYLDSDTYMCANCDELFELLQKFEIATAHAPYRRSPKDYDLLFDDEFMIEGVPTSFPEMNCGVILFKKHPRVEQFFAQWLSIYQKQMSQPAPPVNDQPSFLQALYGSDLRHATLPPEYNCRFVFPVFVSGVVKILHGWHPDFPALAASINANPNPRVCLAWDIFQHSGIEDLGADENGTHYAQILVRWDFSKSHTREMDELRQALQETQHALQIAQNQFNNMQRSPFWKLRDLVVRLTHSVPKIPNDHSVINKEV